MSQPCENSGEKQPRTQRPAENPPLRGLVQYRTGFRPNLGEEAFVITGADMVPQGVFRCVITAMDANRNDVECGEGVWEAKCTAVIIGFTGRHPAPLPASHLTEPKPRVDGQPDTYRVMSGSDAVSSVLGQLKSVEAALAEERHRHEIEKNVLMEAIMTAANPTLVHRVESFLLDLLRHSFIK